MSLTRRTLLTRSLLLGAMATMVATACAPAAAPAPTSAPAAAKPAQQAPAAAKPSEYVIGATIPMTGVSAAFATLVQPGGEMAIKDIMAKGGIGGAPVRLQWEDGELQPRTSVTAMQKLLDVYKTPVILTGGSSVVLAQRPIADEKRVLLGNIAAVSPRLRKEGTSLVNFLPTSDAEGRDLADIMLAQNLKETAIIHVDNDFGEDTTKAFVDAYTAKGGKVILTEKHALGTTDMRTQLIKLKSANPPALVIFSSQGEVGHVVKQAKELGLEAAMFGENSSTTGDNFQIAGDAMEGLQGVRFAFDPARTKESQDFADRFREQHNRLPSVYDGITYDAVTLIALGYQNAGYDGHAVSNWLRTVRNHPGVMGPISIGEDGTVDFPIARFKVEGGKVVDVK